MPKVRRSALNSEHRDGDHAMRHCRSQTVPKLPLNKPQFGHNNAHNNAESAPISAHCRAGAAQITDHRAHRHSTQSRYGHSTHTAQAQHRAQVQHRHRRSADHRSQSTQCGVGGNERSNPASNDVEVIVPGPLLAVSQQPLVMAAAQPADIGGGIAPRVPHRDQVLPA